MTREATSTPTTLGELELLSHHCQHLRLTRVAQRLPTLLEQAAQQELSYSAFLHTLLAEEVASRQEKHQALRVQMARFPFHKTLDAFDWKAQKLGRRSMTRSDTAMSSPSRRPGSS